MSRKRHSPEQIVGMLREAEVSLSHGQSAGQEEISFGAGLAMASADDRTNGPVLTRLRISGSDPFFLRTQCQGLQGPTKGRLHRGLAQNDHSALGVADDAGRR